MLIQRLQRSATDGSSGNVFRGNVLTGVVVGIGALLLVPAIGQVLRPAAKAVIKGGILASQGLAELGETASDLVAEARAEMDQQENPEDSTAVAAAAK
jgi:hypothetical protein